MNITKWIEQLADADTSAEIDWARMQRLLRSVGYPRAVVTMGVAYLDGRGTMANPPRSIHAVAQQLRVELVALQTRLQPGPV
jgi:TPR repeat protein